MGVGVGVGVDDVGGDVDDALPDDDSEDDRADADADADTDTDTDDDDDDVPAIVNLSLSLGVGIGLGLLPGGLSTMRWKVKVRGTLDCTHTRMHQDTQTRPRHTA